MVVPVIRRRCLTTFERRAVFGRGARCWRSVLVPGRPQGPCSTQEHRFWLLRSAKRSLHFSEGDSRAADLRYDRASSRPLIWTRRLSILLLRPRRSIGSLPNRVLIESPAFSGPVDRSPSGGSIMGNQVVSIRFARPCSPYSSSTRPSSPSPLASAGPVSAPTPTPSTSAHARRRSTATAGSGPSSTYCFLGLPTRPHIRCSGFSALSPIGWHSKPQYERSCCTRSVISSTPDSVALWIAHSSRRSTLLDGLASRLERASAAIRRRGGR